jgi:hypothetical protein
LKYCSTPWSSRGLPDETSLGARESGTERLEEAVAAYREALKERTRERVPLYWAMTQFCALQLASKGEKFRRRSHQFAVCRLCRGNSI